MVVNGELSVHGQPVTGITRRLARDAWVGESTLHLDDDISGVLYGGLLVV